MPESCVQYDLVIRGGTVVSSSGWTVADVGIRAGRIETVGDLAGAIAETELDAHSLHVLPGVIDSHVHLREPGNEHKEDLESGTRAAVLGGVCTVFDMPNTNPPTVDAAALADKVSRAAGRTWVNTGFYVGASPDNLDALGELELLPGAAGVKLFMGSSTGSLLVPDDEGVRAVLTHGRRTVAVHAEDEYRLRERMAAYPGTRVHEHPTIRDAECAHLATQRLIGLCADTRRPVHVLHVSTADEIPLLSGAKRREVPLTAEVCPQHLWFEAPDCYDRLGTRAQQNPPIRDGKHRAALRAALAAGVFDTFGSDHAPHLLKEKAKPYPQSPSGMPGVQTLVPACLTLVAQGLLTLEMYVRMACERPAKIFGARSKGSVAPGYDADLTVVDLNARRTVERSWVASRCAWSPYEVIELQGWPVATVVGGRLAMLEGELQGAPIGRCVSFEVNP